MGDPLSYNLFALASEDEGGDAGAALRRQRQFTGAMGQSVTGLGHISRTDTSANCERDLVLTIPEAMGLRRSSGSSLCRQFGCCRFEGESVLVTLTERSRREKKAEKEEAGEGFHGECS